LVIGAGSFREAAAGWLARRRVTDVDPANILPTIGSKELITSLPGQLGLGAGDTIVIPELAYPSYAVGALAAGAAIVASDSLVGVGPAKASLVWVNSPSNPTGRVLPPEHLAKIVAWGRERGALVVSDECYAELGWTANPVSILDPSVCGGSHEGVLAVHSLSKRSNLAGYRAGFVTGDPSVIAELLAVRRHLGLIMPGPVQAAATAALLDDVHVTEQRERYGRRRTVLLDALLSAGFDVDASEAGLYLWATRREPCMQTVAALSEQGILVAPGDFYGPAGAAHVRVALTATDERVDAAARRLRT
jgi:succinyldiaminopimelate transaminase